jgi:hypothetical protein
LNDRKHEDSGTRIAHEIEAKLSHGDKVHSTLHDELHKLQKQDSHQGVVSSGKFQHDVHTVESKLHKDGYLPNLHISVDHKSHVSLQHIKHHSKDPSERTPGSNDHHKKDQVKHPTTNGEPHADGRDKAQPKPLARPERDPGSGKELQIPLPPPKPTLDCRPAPYPASDQNVIPNRDPNSGRAIDPNRDPNSGNYLAPNRDPNSGRDVIPRGQDIWPDLVPNRDPNPERFVIPYPALNPGSDVVPHRDPNSGRDFVPNRDPNSGRDVVPYRDPNSGRDFVPNRDPNAGRDVIPNRDPNSGRDVVPYREENPFRLPPNDQIGNRLVPFDQGGEPIKNSGEFREMHLENRSAAHAGADALVYVRKDFDPSKPVHLVVYNHGFESTVTNALQRNQIMEMMSQAQANTVLVLPEWQANPGSRSGQSGTFQQQDKFTKMVQEMMQKTPALHGASLNNVDRIDIIAHSAGYSPTEAEIYNNPAISGKVHSITLLDSLYDRHGFDKWLGDNINDLSAGRKQFYNFSNSSTATNSREQAKLVASMLHNKRLPTNNYVADYGTSKGEVARHGAEMAERSIVFASTTTRHGEIPGKYIGATLAALNPERSQMPFIGS